MKALNHLIDELIMLPQSAQISLHPTEHYLVVKDKGKHLSARIELPIAVEFIAKPEPEISADPDFSFSDWGKRVELEEGCATCEFSSETIDVSVEGGRFTVTLYMEGRDNSATVRFGAVFGDWLNAKDEYQWLRRSGILKEFHDDLVAGKVFKPGVWNFYDRNFCRGIPLVEKWDDQLTFKIYTAEHSLVTAWLASRFGDGGPSFWSESDELP